MALADGAPGPGRPLFPVKKQVQAQPLDGFPTADHVAIALVTADRLFGTDPELALAGAQRKGTSPEARTRWLSAAALIGCFPDAAPNALAKLVGLPSAWHVKNYRPEWWEDGLVAEVEDAILNF